MLNESGIEIIEGATWNGTALILSNTEGGSIFILTTLSMDMLCALTGQQLGFEIHFGSASLNTTNVTYGPVDDPHRFSCLDVSADPRGDSFWLLPCTIA